MDELTKWIFEQLGTIIVMGVAIFWLSKRLVKAEDEKDKLSQDVIKLTTLWESKANNLSEGDKEFKEKILTLLIEIKGSIHK
tara:strand:- start:1021 stop:1266 length:246 start_codon:yes stop_codon:yes gene_type:complete